MNLAILQLFHQYFNGPQSKLGRGAGQAAYMVYVIHLPVVMTAVIAFCEIMMAATVADICSVRLPRCCLLRIGREL